MTKQIRQWITHCNPDDVGILVEEAPLDYGYLLVLEYENGEILLASSRNPSRYMNAHLSRENSVGGAHPVRVGISPQLWRYEAAKRILQKRLMDYRKAGESRFVVPGHILQKTIDGVLSVATLSRGRREGDVG